MGDDHPWREMGRDLLGALLLALLIAAIGLALGGWAFIELTEGIQGHSGHEPPPPVATRAHLRSP